MGRQRMRRGAKRRCAVAGCERRVRPGRVVCAEHFKTAEGQAAQRGLRRMVGELAVVAVEQAGTGGEATLGTFRRRVARGDYGELLDEALLEVVLQAGAERSLQEEVGALRVAAKRLLLEEEDASKMALGLSRVTTALMRMLEGKGEIERQWVNEASLRRLREQHAELDAQREARARAAKTAQAADGAPTVGVTGDEGAKGEGRWTIRKAVDEWRVQGGEERAAMKYGGVTEGEEIVDLFTEMRPGGWRHELPEDAG